MATHKWLPYFYYINPSFSFLRNHRLIKINLKPISPQTTPRGVAIQHLYQQKNHKFYYIVCDILKIIVYLQHKEATNIFLC